MPVYTIQAPDGRTMKIQAPDQATAMRGAQQWVAQNPAGPDKVAPYGLAGLVNGQTGGQSGLSPAAQRVRQQRNATMAGLHPNALDDMDNAATHAMSFGLDTDIQPALGALGQGAVNLVNHATGQPITTTMGDRYAGERQAMLDELARGGEQHPIASGVGGVMGSFAAPGAGKLTKAITAPSLAARMIPGATKAAMATRAVVGGVEATAKSAAIGSALGAQAGFQNAPQGQRVQGAQQGAVAGALVGAALPVAGAVTGAVAKRTVVPAARTAIRALNRATGGALLDPTKTAMARLSEAMPPPAELRQAQADWTATGAPEPYVMNVGGNTVQRLLRAAAAKAGPASKAAQEFADQQAADLHPTAIARTRQLTPDQRPAQQVAQDLEAGREAAKQLNQAQYAAPIDAAPVLPAIEGETGRKAMQGAADWADAHRLPAQRQELQTLDLVSRPVVAQPSAMENDPAQILQAVNDHLGVSPDLARGNVDALVAKGQAAAKPIYDAITTKPEPVWSADLARIAQRPIVKKAMGTAATGMLNRGENPTVAGLKLDPDTGWTFPTNEDGTLAIEQHPTAATWDRVYKALGQNVERHPITNEALPNSISTNNADTEAARGDLRRLLAGDETTPGAIADYGTALSTAGDYASVRGALNRGRNKLFNGSVYDFNKFWNSLEGDAEQNAGRSAVANDILEAYEKGRLRPGSFGAPGVQQKLATAFGGDRANRFISAVQANPAPTLDGPVSLGALDQVKERLLAMGKSAEGNPKTADLAPGYYQRANEIDAHLAKLNPEYATNRDTIALQDRALAALKAGDINVSSDSPDATRMAMAEIAPDHAPLPGIQLRQNLTDAIGAPKAGATGILNTIASGTNAGENLAAVYGPEEAARYQAALRNVAQVANDAAFVAPNTGAKSVNVALDQGLVDHSTPIPHSLHGLVLAAIDKARRGATMTDEERLALVRLGQMRASQAPDQIIPTARRAVAPYLIAPAAMAAGSNANQ